MTAGLAPQVTRYTGWSTIMSSSTICSNSPAPSRCTWRQKFSSIARCSGLSVRSTRSAVGPMQSSTACSKRFMGRTLASRSGAPLRGVSARTRREPGDELADEPVEPAAHQRAGAGDLRVELGDPADRRAAVRQRVELDRATVVLHRQTGLVRVGEAPVLDELGDRVAPGHAPRAQHAHGADPLALAGALALELEAVDRRPRAPRRAVPQEGVDGRRVGGGGGAVLDVLAGHGGVLLMTWREVYRVVHHVPRGTRER